MHLPFFYFWMLLFLDTFLRFRVFLGERNMRSGRCLFATTSIDLVDRLQEKVRSDVISIIPVERLGRLRSAPTAEQLHSAVVFTSDALESDPQATVQQIRQTDPGIVVIALLGDKNDLLEQELLELGCDDVMTVPICVDTLATRLLLRIRQRGWSIGNRQVVRIHETTVDFQELKIYRNGRVHALSRGLADVLQYFLENANSVVDRKEITNTLWQRHCIDPDGKNLDMHVSKLRRLLEPQTPGRPRLFQTVRSVGYRMNLPPDAVAFNVDIAAVSAYLEQPPQREKRTAPAVRSAIQVCT